MKTERKVYGIKAWAIKSMRSVHLNMIGYSREDAVDQALKEESYYNESQIATFGIDERRRELRKMARKITIVRGWKE